MAGAHEAIAADEATAADQSQLWMDVVSWDCCPTWVCLPWLRIGSIYQSNLQVVPHGPVCSAYFLMSQNWL